MDSLLIHPNNKEQLEALKVFAKALKMKFETVSTDASPYDPVFVKKIQSGREAVKNGKGTKIAIEDLWS